MKKILFSFFLAFLFIPNVNALEKSQVELVYCSSVSNIWIKQSNTVKRIQLLAIKSDYEELGSEINEYVCSSFKNANSIELEYDTIKTDKYNRDLVYVYINGSLFQQELIKKGYAQVDNVMTYLNKTSTLCETQKSAIIEKKGIWNLPNIKESYCKSGINLESKEEIKKSEPIKKQPTLKYLIFLNSGILVLTLLMKRE